MNNKKILHYIQTNLSAMLNEMHIAMLIVGHDDAILYYNDAMQALYPTIAIHRRKPYTRVIQEQSVQEHMRTLTSDTPSYTTEVTINNILYTVSMSSMHENMRIILFSTSSIPHELGIMKNDVIVHAIHELKTPTTTIKEYTELLRKEPHNIEHHIDVINNNTDRILHILHNVLTLSELERNYLALYYEKFALDELIKNVGYYFEHMLKKKNLKLKIRLHTHPLYIEADKAKIQELLHNLLENAIKYTDMGHVSIHTSHDYDETIIIVRDTGIGISKKYHARIFERFFVINQHHIKRASGTGLGLSIVKQIIHLHKGRVSVTSKPGIGTDIAVRLPSKKPYH